jgi:uncharacterized protein
MRFAIPVFASLILCAAGPALSQSILPSFDCARSDSDAEDAICADDGLAELDLEVNRLYGLALTGTNMTSDRAEELKQSQRDWIRDRRECWKASIGLDSCVANAYAFRIHALREGYADARSDDGAGISRGPVALRCGGMDALISAVFLNGKRSLVSLQWLDRGMVLPRVPSGSGGKYESGIWDGGTSLLWVHGNEAIFSEPGGAEMTCVVEQTG